MRSHHSGLPEAQRKLRHRCMTMVRSCWRGRLDWCAATALIAWITS